LVRRMQLSNFRPPEECRLHASKAVFRGSDLLERRSSPENVRERSSDDARGDSKDDNRPGLLEVRANDRKTDATNE
jgi:hypothetical protein